MTSILKNEPENGAVLVATAVIAIAKRCPCSANTLLQV